MGLVGFTRRPITVALGRSSRINSSRFGAIVTAKRADTRDIAAGPVHAGDKAVLDRVAAGLENDRYRGGCRLCCEAGCGRDACGNNSRLESERDQPPAPATDRIDRPPTDIRLLRCGPLRSRFRSDPVGTRQMPHCVGGAASRYPITGIAGCCARAASGHAAAAPPSSVMNSRRPHSITSSARASSVDGTSRPSALAVSSVDHQLELARLPTGRSAGLAPLRMRPA